MRSSHLPARRAASLSAMLCATVLLAACGKGPASPAASGGEVTAVTAKANEAFAAGRDLSDPASFADAKRGFIAAPTGQVRDAAGKVIWDFDGYAFVKGAAPATVNPSLWRQALLNNQTGLFKVSEGIYQLRGFDLANITLSSPPRQAHPRERAAQAHEVRGPVRTIQPRAEELARRRD